MSPRVLYYACGGGLGHVTRTVSLARQLARSGGDHVVVTNTPFAGAIERIRRVEADLRFVLIPSGADPKETAAQIIQVHDSWDPHVLVVDTFPRGVGGELVGLFSRAEHNLRVLISRYLPPKYVEEFRLRQFVAEHFHLVIAPGEPSGIPPFSKGSLGGFRQFSERQGQIVEFLYSSPFLIRDADELPNREKAARWLSTDPHRLAALFVGSGTTAECDELEKVFHRLNQRKDLRGVQLRWCRADASSRSRETISHWPIIECLPAVDLVIGSAGYNLYWETKVLQIPGLLRARPRKYDRQSLRSNLGPSPFSIDNLARTMCQLNVRPETTRQYENGVFLAARAICQMSDHPADQTDPQKANHA